MLDYVDYPKPFFDHHGITDLRHFTLITSNLESLKRKLYESLGQKTDNHYMTNGPQWIFRNFNCPIDTSTGRKKVVVYTNDDKNFYTSKHFMNCKNVNVRRLSGELKHNFIEEIIDAACF